MARDLSYGTEKARSKLGWHPSLSYREAIARTIRWYDESTAQNGTVTVGESLPPG